MNAEAGDTNYINNSAKCQPVRDCLAACQSNTDKLGCGYSCASMAENVQNQCIQNASGTSMGLDYQALIQNMNTSSASVATMEPSRRHKKKHHHHS